MRRLIMLPVLWGLSAGAFAEEPAKPAETSAKAVVKRVAGDIRTWFQHLKEGLTESSVSGQRQKGRATAVAAVRGSKQKTVEIDKPAWKSGAQTRKSRQLQEQRAEFAAAVDLAIEGKYAEAGEKLDAFSKAHPDSPLLEDVKQAREKVREAQLSSAKP